MGDADGHAGEESDAGGLLVEVEPRAGVEREARARPVAEGAEREEAAWLYFVVALAGVFGLKAEVVFEVARDRDGVLTAMLPTRAVLAAEVMEATAARKRPSPTAAKLTPAGKDSRAER